jgi:hypothetical protein
VAEAAVIGVPDPKWNAYGDVEFAHRFLVQFPDACLRQSFYEDNPVRDAVAGNNATFDKALKMGPDLLVGDLLAGLVAKGRFRPLRSPKDSVTRLFTPQPGA